MTDAARGFIGAKGRTDRSAADRSPFAPARQEITAFDLEVSGQIPADLDGCYLRNGPNPVGVEHPRMHYYLGAGMIHGVRLADGRAHWYRNRWVRQSAVTRALGEEPQAYRVLGGLDESSNTNVIGFGGRILSLVEGGTLPFELDRELETIGPYDFDGALRTGMSAHPKIDPATGDMHTVGYLAGSPRVEYTVFSPEGALQHSVAIDLPHRPMMHDFALTGSYAILFDLPARFSMMAAVAREPFPFRWNRRARARLGLLPRHGTEVTWFEIEPVWIYHTVNAYDVDEGVVLDVVTHPTMFTGATASIDGHGLPRLVRYRFDTRRGSVSREVLDDRPQEFPRINDHVSGRPHRFAYTACTSPMVDAWRAPPRELDEVPDAEFGNALYKHTTVGGDVERRAFGRDAHVGEAAYVPRRDGGDAEDNGYLLVFAHNPERGATDLVILDAADFTGEELARVHLPARVPLGLHGSWIAS